MLIYIEISWDSTVNK